MFKLVAVLSGLAIVGTAIVWLAPVVIPVLAICGFVALLQAFLRK